MIFKTIKAVKEELHRRGGYLETIRDTELPEYAPHFSMSESGWKNGVYIKKELMEWANSNLV